MTYLKKYNWWNPCAVCGLRSVLCLILLAGYLWPVPLSASDKLLVCAGCEFQSIRQAIEAARAHDTVVVQAGTYQEYDISITKPITLLGEGYPVIDGASKGEIITIQADSVVVDGLYLKNVGTSYTKDFAALRVVESQAFQIRNVRMENLFFGIYLEKSRNGLVEGNVIKGDAVEEFNSGNGIQLWYSHDVIVRNNKVSGVRDGIYLEFSDRIRIENNVSTHNVRYGLHFMFSNDDSYENNLFENNGAGVAVMFSKNILMRQNRFRNNWGSASFGLLLKEINDAEILENHFEDNTVGISIEGSNRITYTKNVFESNGWAVKVNGACYANTFEYNNFLYNSFDLSYNGKVNDNIFRRNYWSNYTGYDLDKDRIGDIPYRPVRLFSYVVNRTPETIVLLRSLFMDIIDFSEKVSPVFTPDALRDAEPLMRPTQG